MSIGLLNSEISRLTKTHAHISTELLQIIALKLFTEQCTFTLNTTVLPKLEAYAEQYTKDRNADQPAQVKP